MIRASSSPTLPQIRVVTNCFKPAGMKAFSRAAILLKNSATQPLTCKEQSDSRLPALPAACVSIAGNPPALRCGARAGQRVPRFRRPGARSDRPNQTTCK